MTDFCHISKSGWNIKVKMDILKDGAPGECQELSNEGCLGSES